MLSRWVGLQLQDAMKKNGVDRSKPRLDMFRCKRLRALIFGFCDFSRWTSNRTSTKPSSRDNANTKCLGQPAAKKMLGCSKDADGIAEQAHRLHQTDISKLSGGSHVDRLGAYSTRDDKGRQSIKTNHNDHAFGQRLLDKPRASINLFTDSKKSSNASFGILRHKKLYWLSYLFATAFCTVIIKMIRRGSSLISISKKTQFTLRSKTMPQDVAVVVK